MNNRLLLTVFSSIIFVGCGILCCPEPPLPEPIGESNSIIIMGISISNPTPYTNYPAITINNNIDNSTKLIDSLEKRITTIEKDTTLTPMEISKEKTKVSEQVSNVKSVKKEWEKIAIYSTEWRAKNGNLVESIKHDSTNFHVFLDVNYGDFLGKITDLFGNPDETGVISSYPYEQWIKYTINGKEALYARAPTSTKRISYIRISGEEGYNLAQSKNITDSKYKLLLLNISRIEEAFEEKLNNYGSEYRIGSKNDYGLMTFACPISENYTCQSISISWK